MNQTATLDLKGKVALVTGAGGEKGFGRAIARRLAEAGAHVAVTDIADNPYGQSGWAGLGAVARELEHIGVEALTYVADITRSDEVTALVDAVIKRFGRIDILVANAGSRPGPDRVPVISLPESAFDEVQRVNVKGTFLCCQAVGMHMTQRAGGGRVIIIASTAGKRGLPRYAAYTASKFALVGFGQSFAHEMGGYRVTVNVVCPGLAGTERIEHIADALRPEGISVDAQVESMMMSRAESNPLGRNTEPRDVARLVKFFASEEAEYLTGLAISVSGGDVMN